MVIDRIPPKFLKVPYIGKKYPGNASGVSNGANCQHFCYEVLRHYGFEVGNLRSSELWEDQVFTKKVETIQVFDILLFNSSMDSFGAHLGICLGEGKILHLSKKVGKPAVWSLGQFLSLPEYSILVGIKRPFKTTTELTKPRLESR